MSNPLKSQSLEFDFAHVLRRDEHRLRTWWRRLQNMPLAERALSEAKWQEAFQKSASGLMDRVHRFPWPNLDASLPIFERADHIRELLLQHQVIVVSGETGSGKSTQLPLIALQAGFGRRGWIGHTQPRRIAARGVASRLAEQLKCRLGDEVGYRIRFTDQTSDRTFIKLMTDGILLAETQRDRFLDNYELLIIDEAHERSLNVDFILGHLKRILRTRSDLRLIITSATIDVDRFASHFADTKGEPAPVLQVEGRTYPVAIEYRPVDAEDDDIPLLDEVVASCRQLLATEPGDILVFLPTEGEILNVAKKLRGARLTVSGQPVDILPLYARLSFEQQNQVFAAHRRVRIVLATNVAESSITVPGIRYVVDSGTARISRYAPRSKVQRLPIEPISQASARQRAGRCGRVAPGICVRLYSEEDFNQRPEFTTPEIRRTNLAGTILQLLALGLGDIEAFPFLDPPAPEAIRDGFKTLFELGALDDHRHLTEMGRRLARLPVDPRVARMLFAAADRACLHEVLILAAALEVPDPRLRPVENQAAADATHSAWTDPRSDFLGILKLWDFLHNLKSTLSKSQFRKALQQNFLSQNHVAQWQDVHRQLQSLIQIEKQPINQKRAEPDSIHQSMLAGLLSSVAMLRERNEYLGAGGITFFLWPGSGTINHKPKWVVAAEIVETTRRFGRCVAEIDPAWLEQLAGHLVKRAYADPHWSSKSQTALAFENVTLFGLPIIARRRLGLANVDPEVSRQLFIQHGLVENQIQHPFAFHQHNCRLLKNIAELTKKTRRRDLLVENGVLASFYDSRLPPEAVDVRALQQLIKSDRNLDQYLRMSWEAFGLEQEDSSRRFPDRVQVGQIELPVEYEFKPGAEDDGANLKLPAESLGQIDKAQLGWLIPGLLEERVEALIRNFPKALRRNLIPAKDVAREVMASIPYGEGSFEEAVARELSRRSGESISRNDLGLERLPPHLLVNLQVVDSQGKVIASGRDLDRLLQNLPDEMRPREIAAADPQWNLEGATNWIWGDLPNQVPIQRGNVKLFAFPAIIDQGERVGLRLLDSPGRADFESRQGLTRLCRLIHRKLVKSQVAWLPELDRISVSLRRWLAPEPLKDSIGDLLVRVGMVDDQPLPRTKSEFESRQQLAGGQIAGATQLIAKWLPRLAEQAQAASLLLEKLPARHAEARAEMLEQLADLLRAETWLATPWSSLQHFPRYIQATAVRSDKLLASDGKADRAAMFEVKKFLEFYQARRIQLDKLGLSDAELDKFRWLIEELRVSLFAQQLGTSQPVSVKRLEKLREGLAGQRQVGPIVAVGSEFRK